MALPLARGSDGLLSTRRCVREYREARAAEAASMGVGFYGASVKHDASCLTLAHTPERRATHPRAQLDACSSP